MVSESVASWAGSIAIGNRRDSQCSLISASRPLKVSILYFTRQMMLLCKQGTLHEQVEEVSSSVVRFVIETAAIKTHSLHTLELP